MTIIRSHQEFWPINVITIANALGLTVLENSGWPDDIAGQIAKDNLTQKYVITINAKQPVTRKRFTVAHEIAHYVLHQDRIGDGIVDDVLFRSRLGGRLEVEANDLAADILMPWALINKAMDDYGANSIEALASLFNVSKSAMSIRLGVPYE
jgi:Zn-dependent peptidase ImmA (M78 family)